MGNPTGADLQTLQHLLTCEGEEETILFRKAANVRDTTIGNSVRLRGLIEISNICHKDCLYCGIRKSNHTVRRYALTDKEIIDTALFAWEQNFGSIVLQSGERADPAFTVRIENLLKDIRKLTRGELGITLSLGEQETDTYKRWFESGAHRYLLRIETSNEDLYKKIHPSDELHSFHTRLECIEQLRKCGYQTGTGVMIGLPFQTTEDLVRDLLFFKTQDIDMVGMGPYLEHPSTPLYQYRHLLLPELERLRLSIHMVACLRLLMPNINIAATTALQAIDPLGREKALAAGANVMMPNITPQTGQSDYKLYPNKPCVKEGALEAIRQLKESVKNYGCEIRMGEWGDSQHFHNRQRQD